MPRPMEEFVFELIDQCKLLFFPEQWNNAFMEYSKNEVFVLFYVYRKGGANMTEIAEYIGVPLNTATGIISRLEKRGVIRRQRDMIDKRVVTIAISEEGTRFLLLQLQELEHYYQLFMASVTEEEKRLLVSLIGRFLDIISKDLSNKKQVQETKKTIRKIIIE